MTKAQCSMTDETFGMTQFLDLLRLLKACPTGQRCAAQHKTIAGLWDAWSNYDYLEWLLCKIGVNYAGERCAEIKRELDLRNVIAAAEARYNELLAQRSPGITKDLDWMYRPSRAPLPEPPDHLTRLGFLPRVTTESLQRSSL
jgi:hypothetical protein